MAAQKAARAVDKKRKSKKRKSRTEISSSESSSESEAEQKKSRKNPSTEEESQESTPEPTPASAKPSKKQKSKTSATSATTTNSDIPMRDTSSPPSSSPVSAPVKSHGAPWKVDGDFDAIYIRKITTELADDLDKVRSAQDFKANSIPMLIHALKQGESLFSGEEKRRVVGSSKA